MSRWIPWIAVLAALLAVAVGAVVVDRAPPPETVASADSAPGSADASRAPETSPSTIPSTTTSTTAPTIDETTTTTTAPPPVSIAAKASGPVDVFDRPGAATPVRTLPATTVLGTPTVVSVLDDTVEGWVEAMLPGRPNGATGWIRAGDLEVFTFDREVVVDLSDRLLTVYTEGVANFQTDVAVGSAESPTPTGTFFVTDAVELTRPKGPWGPFAFGLSARSDVVTEFAGGDGIIGIHGTNQPWSIGEAASLGCVRLPNDVMATLWEIVAVGMKVTIVA